MLHIFFLILKIIGWIVLAILGIVVLFVCAVLFTPLRYQAEGSCKGDLASLHIHATFSYFLRLIRGNVCYKDGRLIWKLNVAWKRFGESEKKQTEKPIGKAESTMERDGKTEKQTAEKQTAEKHVAVSDATESYVVEKQTAANRAAENCVAVDSAESRSAEKKQPVAEKKVPPKGNRTNRRKSITTAVSEKLSVRVHRISCTIRKFCAKIKAILRKKEILTAFITNETHKAAFFKTLEQLKKLLKRMKPRQYDVNLQFGFEDPAITGKVLAVISMVYPSVCGHTEISPDFEQKILVGEVFFKGHLRARIIAAMAWNLFWSKEVRTTVRHIMKFKF